MELTTANLIKTIKSIFNWAITSSVILYVVYTTNNVYALAAFAFPAFIEILEHITTYKYKQENI